MLEAKHNFLHRHLPFADDPRGVKQDEAPYQVTIIAIFSLDLAGLGNTAKQALTAILLDPMICKLHANHEV